VTATIVARLTPSAFPSTAAPQIAGGIGSPRRVPAPTDRSLQAPAKALEAA
jgi:hypothetical protein